MDTVSEIVTELRSSYATEIQIIEDYLANASNLEGERAEAVRNLFNEEVQTALGHARRLAKRIKALEGTVPGSRELLRVQADLRSPANIDNPDIALLDAIKSEDAAIARYERIIRLCDGHDFVTLDLVIELLIDERERRQRLIELAEPIEMDPSPGR
jgi:bacterioferritin